MLEKQMLITLNNEEDYIVLNTLIHNNINYVYLVSHPKMDQIKFCIQEEENNQIKLIEVEDITLRQELLKLFTEKLQKENI